MRDVTHSNGSSKRGKAPDKRNKRNPRPKLFPSSRREKKQFHFDPEAQTPAASNTCGAGEDVPVKVANRG
jgi:hypothetical protein